MNWAALLQAGSRSPVLNHSRIRNGQRRNRPSGRWGPLSFSTRSPPQHALRHDETVARSCLLRWHLLNYASGQLVCYKKRPSLCANNTDNFVNVDDTFVEFANCFGTIRPAGRAAMPTSCRLWSEVSWRLSPHRSTHAVSCHSIICRSALRCNHALPVPK